MSSSSVKKSGLQKMVQKCNRVDHISQGRRLLGCIDIDSRRFYNHLINFLDFRASTMSVYQQFVIRTQMNGCTFAKLVPVRIPTSHVHGWCTATCLGIVKLRKQNGYRCTEYVSYDTVYNTKKSKLRKNMPKLIFELQNNSFQIIKFFVFLIKSF